MLRFKTGFLPLISSTELTNHERCEESQVLGYHQSIKLIRFLWLFPPSHCLQSSLSTFQYVLYYIDFSYSSIVFETWLCISSVNTLNAVVNISLTGLMELLRDIKLIGSFVKWKSLTKFNFDGKFVNTWLQPHTVCHSVCIGMITVLLSG